LGDKKALKKHIWEIAIFISQFIFGNYTAEKEFGFVLLTTSLGM